MDVGYQLVRLWQRPAEQLLAAELGIAPLAMLGRLPEGVNTQDGLAAAAQRLVERLTSEAEPARATKLLTSALLLAGLRVDRHAAINMFRGVYMLEESDTYMMILERGEERGEQCARRGDVLLGGFQSEPAQPNATADGQSYRR